jgi:hypothetical protein
MQKVSIVRIAIDNCIINWKACQGQSSNVQADAENRNDYEAIEKLFQLQEKCDVVLVAVDQLDREARKTSDVLIREKLLNTINLCHEKFFLTRFEASISSKKAAKAKGKSGINLGQGAYWITEDNNRKIKEYISNGQTGKEKVDLEVLATVAIAGVRRFVTVDNPLLTNTKIKEFIKRKDGIQIYRPSEIIKLLNI